jgi:multidrug efflux pump subunit AcrB
MGRPGILCPGESSNERRNAAIPHKHRERLQRYVGRTDVTQILNFGLPAQIDVRTVGYDRVTNLRVAKELRQRIAAIPGIADAHLQQEVNAPALYATIDRTRAAGLDLTANAIASNINVSLSSSAQVAPNFWTDPASGIPYYIAVQTPEPRLASFDNLRNTPVSTALSTSGDPVPGLLSNLATLSRGSVRPTETRRTSSRSTRSMPAFKAATSAASLRSSTSSSPSLHRNCPPGTPSRWWVRFRA